MSAAVRVACIQLNAGREIAPNIAAASALIREARANGAQFILTPENTSMIEPKRPLLLEKAKPEDEHPGLPAFSSLAAELGVWLLIGSMQVKLDADTCANRSFLFDDRGRIVARYDKIHMFDVDLEGGESYRESSRFRAGDRAVLADTPWGKVGRLSLPCPGTGRRRLPHRALCIHHPDRPGALGDAAARPRHRNRLLRLRASPVRRARRGPPDLRSLADRFALGRDPGRGRRGDRHHLRRCRSGQG
jgi:Carbon-nitrogen hydrolase